MRVVIAAVLVLEAVVFGTTLRAEPFVEPPHVEVTPDHPSIVVRARRGPVEMRGLGRVDNAAVYDIKPGSDPGVVPTAPTSLMPPVVEVDRGMTMQVQFVDGLMQPTTADPAKPQPTISNLHTHGLVVSPKGVGSSASAPPTAYGDCVLVVATTKGAPSPHTMHGDSGDPCADVPAGRAVGMATRSGTLAYSYEIARDHPSGLFWIHPHPHKLSEGQVSNGLSALLTIGSLWDYAYLTCRITVGALTPSQAPDQDACPDQDAAHEEARLEGTGAGRGAVEVLDLGLKDIQVQERSPGRYDMIEFPIRDETDAFSAANDNRKNRCGDISFNGIEAPLTFDLSKTGVAPGRCWTKADPKKQWAFTVSGQLYPTLTLMPGKSHIWRLANMSADITYRLRLESGTRRLAFGIRALDGVPMAGTKTALEVMLMPSARVEVVVERCRDAGGTDCIAPNEDATAVLRTVGVYTGNDPSGANPPGDFWPPIDLAAVHFEESRTTAAAPRLKSIGYRAAPNGPLAAAIVSARMPNVVEPAPSTPAAGNCFVKPPHSSTSGPLGGGGDEVRLIRFNNSQFGPTEEFGLHAVDFRLKDLATHATVTVADLETEGRSKTPSSPSKIATLDLAEPCLDEANGSSSDAGTAFANFYPAFDVEAPPNVTAVYETQEFWLLVNDSPECHNFHIHQMKFAVVDADVALDPLHPTDSKDQCLGDRKLTPPIDPSNLQDNYPLPPGARVLVRLRFDGPKLGRFVFHCHILEHEDKGMMATIEVVRPRAP